MRPKATTKHLILVARALTVQLPSQTVKKWYKNQLRRSVETKDEGILKDYKGGGSEKAGLAFNTRQKKEI